MSILVKKLAFFPCLFFSQHTLAFDIFIDGKKVSEGMPYEYIKSKFDIPTDQYVIEDINVINYVWESPTVNFFNTTHDKYGALVAASVTSNHRKSNYADVFGKKVFFKKNTISQLEKKLGYGCYYNNSISHGETLLNIGSFIVKGGGEGSLLIEFSVSKDTKKVISDRVLKNMKVDSIDISTTSHWYAMNQGDNPKPKYCVVNGRKVFNTTQF